jgi:hypothetical protein
MSKKSKMARSAEQTTWFHVVLISERGTCSTVVGVEGGAMKVKRAAALETGVKGSGFTCCDVKEYRLFPFASEADAEASQTSFRRVMARYGPPDPYTSSAPS